MASIHKRQNSKKWYCAFYLPDGTRAFRSTGTTDKRKAMKICLEWDQAARDGREGRLTENQTRRVMHRIFSTANRKENLPSSTLKEFLRAWLQAKQAELAESSFVEYQNTVEAIISNAPTKEDRPMDAYTKADAIALRTTLLRRVSPATCNKYMKIARAAWFGAIEAAICVDNPFQKIAAKAKKETTRRPFTVDEIRRVLAVCDTEWRGMVLFGLYTGQRLSDVASLAWKSLDLVEREAYFTTSKTGRRMAIPMAKPLLDYVAAMPAKDDPGAALFPTLQGIPSNTLARKFSEILMAAGLIEKKTHKATGKTPAKGRTGRRITKELSYHCLRHAATSMLKNGGVTNAVAMELVGHDSESVSRTYTHIEKSTLRKAIDAMPDVTTKEAAQ